jgi:predicted phage-related endonuclease
MNTQKHVIVSTVVADKSIKTKLEHYNAISIKLSALEREKNALKAELLKETKGADHIMDAKGHEIAAWHSQIRQIIDTNRLKVENQTVYEQYLKTCQYITLNVYFKK